MSTRLRVQARGLSSCSRLYAENRSNVGCQGELFIGYQARVEGAMYKRRCLDVSIPNGGLGQRTDERHDAMVI